MKHSIFFLITIGLLFSSCTTDPVFSDYRTMTNNEWHQDSILSFSFNITDTISPYDVLFMIRHTTNYPYQNLWLFTNRDTLEIFLADQRGDWIGNGSGTLREMPVIYQSNMRFSHTGDYTISLQHGMRTEVLKGISDVGLIIQKH